MEHGAAGGHLKNTRNLDTAWGAMGHSDASITAYEERPMEAAEWRVASRAMRPPSITFVTFTGWPLGTLPPSMPESPQKPP